MAVSTSIKDKITKWLGLGGIQSQTNAPALAGYNPEIWLEHSSSPPYTMTIHERVYSKIHKQHVHLKTVLEYDAPYPDGNLQRIYPQEYIDD